MTITQLHMQTFLEVCCRSTHTLSIRSRRLHAFLLASDSNNRSGEKLILFISSFCYLSFHLSLSFLADCWDKPIHAWLVLSLSASVLNKTCAPHAAALCDLQITATLPPSRLSHPSLPSFSSLSSPLSQQMHFSPFPFSTLFSCSSSLFSFPSPIFLSLLVPLLPPSSI